MKIYLIKMFSKNNIFGGNKSRLFYKLHKISGIHLKVT